MVSSTRAPNTHPTRLVQLITLWSLLLWAQQGRCATNAATTTAVILPSASALTQLTHTSTDPVTRRLLRPVTAHTRSLQANTTTNTTAVDPVLAAQWKLLLAFREDNVKCGAFVDKWPTKVPTKPNGWPGVTVKNNMIVSVEFSQEGLCSDDVLTIWAKFPDLTHLDISPNYNFGTPKMLPAGLSVLTGLNYLSISGTGQFSGLYIDDYDPGSDPGHVSAMPSEWSSLTRLTELVLDGWTVQGKLPSSWAALKNLKALTLPVGGLNGPELPPSWGRLTALTRLNVPGVIIWPNNSANVPGQTLLPKAWSGMRSLRAFETPCNNLIGKPAQNGIPIAPYLTSLMTRCGDIHDGCGTAVQVTQLTPLDQMTNLVDLSIDSTTVVHDDPQCFPPKGAFTLPRQWSHMKKLNTLSLKRSRPPSVRDWIGYYLYKIEFDVILPSDWSALTSLQSLDIDLSGWARGYAVSPPESFSSLKALTFLSLQGADYQPYEAPSDGSPLKNIDLLVKQRAGWKLPSSWGALTRLQNLNLNMYGMTNMQLPESYSTMTSLSELIVTGNCPQGTLPSSWGTMKKLASISLPGNAFPDLYKNGLCSRTPMPTGPLPAGWGGMAKLTQIQFSGLSFSGTIPSSWNRLTALKALDLTGNRLKGPLPSSWSTMNKLKWVNLSGNKLNGTLPGSWGKLKSIGTLDLSSNRFSGQPPESWGALSTLTSLTLANNRLSGTIPPTWCAIYRNFNSYLSLDWFKLDLSHNFLKGPIPACKGDQKGSFKSVSLVLTYNKLSGPLPATPWKVGHLNISHNSISGTLPASWSTIFGINLDLDLSYNRFSGSLPASWATASPARRQNLDLSHNKLSGTVPKAYEKFTLLHLNDNQLTGPIVVPKTFTEEYPYIEFLDWDLSGNHFSALPTNIKIKLSYDCQLSYAHNNLRGTLPPGWFAPVGSYAAEAVQFTVLLDFSHNSFSGGVPATWAAAASLNVSHNCLNGTLPKEWGKMWTPLVDSWRDENFGTVLDLSHNRLNGALPTAMYGVKYLDVHKNKLSGGVPPAGSNWVKSGFWDALQYVDLAANAFTGKKPTKPKSATYFNINGTKFSG